jgi:4-hydroxybenzoyl-CoA thioesterase
MPPFSHSFPVRWDDVDHAAIVYYPRFFHYFHLAFEEFIRQRFGASAYLDLLDRRRIGFPAVHADCDYRLPLRFLDIVRVDMAVERLGEKSIRFRYRVYRVEEGATAAGSARDPELCAEGLVVVVATDLAHFRALEIPADVRQLFLELCVDT